MVLKNNIILYFINEIIFVIEEDEYINKSTSTNTTSKITC